MDKIIKNIRSMFIRGEEGLSIILVLVFLALGSLIIAPLLGFMGTGYVTTTDMYERKTDELFAADAGIKDAIWQITYEHMGTLFTSPTYSPAYDPYDYVTENWTYPLTEKVNDKDVNVTIKNIWIPENIDTPPDKTTAANIIHSNRLVMKGDVLSDNITYQINIIYNPTIGDNLTVETIGVWFPEGFTYSENSTNLKSPYQYYTSKEVIPHAGGEAVIWHFADYPFAGDNTTLPVLPHFPGVDPMSDVMESNITLKFASREAGEIPQALSWMTVDGIVDSTYTYSWDPTVRVFQVISVADNTNVIAYVSRKGNNDLMENAISSKDGIYLSPSGELPIIFGNVQLEGDLEIFPTGTLPEEVISGNISYPETIAWPDPEDMTNFYRNQITGQYYDDSPPPPYPPEWDWDYGKNAIRINNQEVGNFLYTGNLLFNKAYPDKWIRINGTIFVDGNLQFAPAQGGNEADVYLNGQTIFATGDLTIGHSTYTFHGPGAIIALGTVTFKPTVSTSSSEPILVMSVNSYVDFSPNGTFYGSVLGNTGGGPHDSFGVICQPNNDVNGAGWGYYNLPSFSGSSDIIIWSID